MLFLLAYSTFSRQPGTLAACACYDIDVEFSYLLHLMLP